MYSPSLRYRVFRTLESPGWCRRAVVSYSETAAVALWTARCEGAKKLVSHICYIFSRFFIFFHHFKQLLIYITFFLGGGGWCKIQINIFLNQLIFNTDLAIYIELLFLFYFLKYLCLYSSFVST